jgi:hypothetical protein
MSQYCGPLPEEEICAGLRYTVSRTGFPVPPLEVMAVTLHTYGYKSEENLWYWDGEIDEELSAGEVIILNCIKECGVVVHHTELAQAFINSELSFPSLHATLNRSPLFRRVEKGLYILRGTPISNHDIKRAEGVGEKTPVNLEVKYVKTGGIVVYLSLGILAIGTGVVFSEQLPNLTGDWECCVENNSFGKLRATETEFRNLQKPFEHLKCKVADRVKFTFDVWKRTVIIEKLVTEYAA